MMRILIAAFSVMLLACATRDSSSATPKDPQWTEVELPAKNIQLRSMFFIDKERGWAVGFKGVVLTTGDGGKTWEKQRGGDLNELLRSVFFLDKKLGWIVGGKTPPHGGDGFPPIILKTEDGGKTWNLMEDLSKQGREFWQISFQEKTGWIFGTPVSFMTKDGGKTWSALNLSVVNDKREPTPSFVSKEEGFDVEGTTLFRTDDGGVTWKSEDITEFMPKGSNLREEFFLKKKVGFAIGNVETRTGEDTLVIETIDGAKTWKLFSRIENRGLGRSAFFSDEDHGWVVTHDHKREADLILHTADGGKTWTVELDFANNGQGHLGSIFFAAKETGFVIGPNRLFRRQE